MIKVSDLIFNLIENDDSVANDVFMVSGGGAMHLVNSVGTNPNLNYYCTHHEQAASIAAEGYSRESNKTGVVVVTSGPGSTNAITGVMGAWVDSIPMVVFSGQVKRETTINRCPDFRLRQLGDQEINIVDIVKPITKYAAMIEKETEVVYHVEKALFLARSGRPGPVWLDIPLDIQGAYVDVNRQKRFDPLKEVGSLFDKSQVDEDIKIVIEKLKISKRPVVIVGNGVRLSGAQDKFLEFAEKLNLPVLTAISGIDIIHSNHKLFFGRPGIIGERSANFIIQNCDLLISLGTRLNLRIISYSYNQFAREAYKISIDIDQNELNKPTYVPDLKIHSDALFFLERMIQKIENDTFDHKTSWFDYCKRMKHKYPVLENNDTSDGYVSSYKFAEVLSRKVNDTDTIVTGNGTVYTSLFQIFNIKKGQRVFSNVGCASMGYGLPASIGASIAKKKGRVLCVTGDGSIQMNLQELQTVLNYKINLKIFCLVNDGYLSIKNTQISFFNGNFVASTPETGVMLPDMLKITEAFGYKTFEIKRNSELDYTISKVLEYDGPVFCQLRGDPFEVLGPKVSSVEKVDGEIVSRPLEDLAPFLSRDEFVKNMIIAPVTED